MRLTLYPILVLLVAVIYAIYADGTELNEDDHSQESKILSPEHDKSAKKRRFKRLIFIRLRKSKGVRRRKFPKRPFGKTKILLKGQEDNTFKNDLKAISKPHLKIDSFSG